MKFLSIMMFFALTVSACAGSPVVSEPAKAKEPAVSQPMPTETVKAMEPTAYQTVPSAVPNEEKPMGRYLDYSKAAFDEAAGKRRVLFFYASWCPTCRSADPNIRANENLFPEDLVVLRVNYNDPQTDEEAKALAKVYGITYQHTFVQIDRQGNALTKWNGGEINELLAKVKPV